MSSLRINRLFRPVGLPKNINPTKKNIGFWIRESKPKLLSKSSYLNLGGIAAAIVGGISAAIGLKSDNRNATWISSLFGLGGVLATIIGIMNGVKDFVEITKVDIQTKSNITKNERTHLPVGLISFKDDEQDNSNAPYTISEGETIIKGRVASNTFSTEKIDSTEKLQAANEKLSDGNSIKSLRVCDIKHKSYPIKTEGHTIDLLVPEEYAKAKPETLNTIIEELQLSLSTKDRSTLKLVKRMVLTMGESFDQVQKRELPTTPGKSSSVSIMGVPYDSETIELYTNDFTIGEDKLTANEEMLIKHCRLDLDYFRVDEFASKCVLDNEIGHIVGTRARALKDTLTTTLFEIENRTDFDFGGHDWDNENDLWVKVCKLEGNKCTSKYGEQTPDEDLAESYAAYLKDREGFSKAFPKKAVLLGEVLSQIST